MVSEEDIEQALALFYEGPGHAPIVSAQHTGPQAQALIECAKELGIPIYENPELLMQLSRLKQGEEIPVELYQLVAQILAFAFFIQGKAPANYDVTNS